MVAWRYEIYLRVVNNSILRVRAMGKSGFRI